MKCWHDECRNDATCLCQGCLPVIKPLCDKCFDDHMESKLQPNWRWSELKAPLPADLIPAIMDASKREWIQCRHCKCVWESYGQPDMEHECQKKKTDPK